MHTTRLRLEGRSIEELKARVLAEHGPAARIVAAERITVGGVGGFFARRHFEVTVEVSPPAAGSRVVIDAPARAGIAALLEDAEEREDALRRGGPDPDAAPGVGPMLRPRGPGRHAAPQRYADDSVPSTRSGAFAEIMDDLTFNAPPEPEDAGRPAWASVPPPAQLLAVPAPLARPGDLVLVVGLPADALAVATAMAASVGSSAVRASGTVSAGGPGRVDDRRGALAARASGVELGESTFLACGWGADGAAVVSAVQADQVWVAVDAGRKPADTARWVGEVAAAVRIDAVATLGAAATATPETVEELGLPIGWVDGRPATSRAA